MKSLTLKNKGKKMVVREWMKTDKAEVLVCFVTGVKWHAKPNKDKVLLWFRLTLGLVFHSIDEAASTLSRKTLSLPPPNSFLSSSQGEVLFVVFLVLNTLLLCSIIFINIPRQIYHFC